MNPRAARRAPATHRTSQPSLWRTSRTGLRHILSCPVLTASDVVLHVCACCRSWRLPPLLPEELVAEDAKVLLASRKGAWTSLMKLSIRHPHLMELVPLARCLDSVPGSAASSSVRGRETRQPAATARSC